MHLENNLVCLYNLVCQFEYFLIFVKLLLKPLAMKKKIKKSKQSNKYHIWENFQD
jgi:hypothetical protein